jgi:hypothetical protein
VTITKENKEKEAGTINQILKNNEYYTPSRKTKKTTSKVDTRLTTVGPHIIQKRKCATFTYFGPCTRIITKPFRTTEIKIAL